MKDEDIKQTVAILEKVAETDLPEAGPDTAISDLPIDSLDLYTVISDMEDLTGKSMDDDAMGSVATVGDLVRHFYGA